MATQSADKAVELQPVSVVGRWIDQLLQQTRSAGHAIAEVDKARRLLRYLAGIRFDIAPHPKHTTDLTRDNVRRSFWQLPLQPADENEGWALIDFCQRAGILTPVEDRWQFSHIGIERALAAEYAIEKLEWVSLRPRHRELLRWTAALVARGGDEQRKAAFFKQLCAALTSAARLSSLDAAEVLTGFQDDPSAAVQDFKAVIRQQLEALTQINSSRLLSRIQSALNQSGCKIDGANDNCLSIESIQPDLLEVNVQNLAQILQGLNGQIPAGDEANWLEDRQVLSALIDGLCHATTPESKRQCAAWLRRSTLSRVLEIHVPMRTLWKSRGQSALELVARIAQDADRDRLTRSLAYGILAKEDFLLRLWVTSDEYIALIYDLLLAADKRLFLTHRPPAQTEWQILD